MSTRTPQTYLVRISDGPGDGDWYHLDRDLDHVLDNGEMIYDLAHNHRYLIVTREFDIDKSVHALNKEGGINDNTVFSKEQGSYSSLNSMHEAILESGADTIVYRRLDGTYTWRMMRNLDGSRNFPFLGGTANECARKFSGLGVDAVSWFLAKRNYTYGPQNEIVQSYKIDYYKDDGTTVTSENPVTALALTLKSTVTGRTVNALWRQEESGLQPDDDFSSQMANEKLVDPTIDVPLGKIKDTGYFNDFAFSREFLINYHTTGTPDEYGIDLPASDKRLLAGPEMAEYKSKDEVEQAVRASASGGALIYQKEDGSWTWRPLRVQDRAGVKKVPRTYLTDDELKMAAQVLGVSQVIQIKTWLMTSATLTENERLAEVQLQVWPRQFEAFYHVYQTRIPADQREKILDYVLSEEMDVQYLIDDVICTWWVKKNQETLPPTGTNKGKTVYFLNAANITHNYISDGVGGQYFESGHRPSRLQNRAGFVADDIAKLRAAGFTVKFVDGASTADMVRAFYDSNAAGIFIDSHGSPGEIEGYPGFALNIADLDRSRMSPSLAAFACFGCEFNNAFDAPMPAANGKVVNRPTSLQEFFGPKVYIAASDKIVYTDQAKKAQSSNSDPLSVSRTAAEIIARTKVPTTAEQPAIAMIEHKQ